MKVLFTEKGKCAGNVSVANTITTMSVGEIWSTSVQEIGSVINAQMAVSRMNKETQMRWTTKVLPGNGILIIRIK